MSTHNETYRLTVSLEVLEHLGDGLYSNIAAVLTEAVANAWDADSSKVAIDFDLVKDSIIISDDGIGMNTLEANERFLCVGYKKRATSEKSPDGRLVMGRKGIGKLSLFSIANIIKVLTQKKNGSIIGFIIDIKKLQQKISEGLEYFPEAVTEFDTTFPEGKGTSIILSELRQTRLREANAESLRRKLARRFSVIGGKNFGVKVNGKAVTTSDRDDIKFAEYIWEFKNSGTDFSKAASLKKKAEIDERLPDWPTDWKIRGWIGTVDRPAQLKTAEGNLNSIVILSRGRLADEDILPRVADAEIYTKYVTGQIIVDFLDSSNSEDIVTSNRQSLREDDERVIKVLAHIRTQMRLIANQWSELRNEDKTDELRKTYPNIDLWLNKQPVGWRKKAEKLLARIATMEIGVGSPEQAKLELIRHSIFGFERLRLRGDAEELEKALGEGVESVLKLFADRESLESSMYRDIVANRLSVINDFESLVDEDQKEKVLQKHLFSNLWLLDPAWDRATEDTIMEERLKLLKPFLESDDVKEKFGRVDIRYRTIAGKHIIVELKRASVSPSSGELLDQVMKYRDAYQEKHSIPTGEKIEIVIVVGKDIPDAQVSISSVVPGSVVITYDELIAKAKHAYSTYLESTKELDFLDNVLSK
jgi:hypothetical protein